MKKIALIIGNGLSAIALLIWPLIAFASIFLFDAPVRGGLDAMSRWIIAGLVLSFPVIAILVFIFLFTKRKQNKIFSRYIALSYLPLVYFLLPLAILTGLDRKATSKRICFPNGYCLDVKAGIRQVIKLHKNDPENYDVIIPFQVTSYQQQTNLVFFRQAKAERWGKHGLSVSAQESSFWVINVKNGNVMGPYSKEELLSNHSIDDNDILFQYEELE